MPKKDLIEAIEAYAAAKSTGNLTLVQMAGGVLKTLLDQLPEELKSTELSAESNHPSYGGTALLQSNAPKES
jgi:hypothetical protein